MSWLGFPLTWQCRQALYETLHVVFLYQPFYDVQLQVLLHQDYGLVLEDVFVLDHLYNKNTVVMFKKLIRAFVILHENILLVLWNTFLATKVDPRSYFFSSTLFDYMYDKLQKHHLDCLYFKRISTKNLIFRKSIVFFFCFS